jgi:hypothetical protein
MRNKKDDQPWDEPDDYFADYDEYAKVLRTWFVAYGIGGPVLLLTNEAVRGKIVASGLSGYIASAFLVGVGLQVVLAITNKTALWGCYKAARQPELRKRRRYCVAHWFAYVLWIDLLFDVVSLFAFGLATYLAFEILTA